MKKSLKIVIATVLLLLAGGAGVVYYFLNVKEYDIADEKVEEITETDYKVDLPDLDSILPADGTTEGEGGSEDNSSSDAESASGDSGSDSTTASTSGSATDSATSTDSKTSSRKEGTKSGSSTTIEGKKNADSSKNKDDKKPAITAETIKAAYRPSFESLEAQANAKIDALVGAAYSEYSAKKQNGESVSITYFYRKYTAAGQALESNTDETFNYLYGSLQNDLEERGFSASEASEFKTQYENAKAARESALIDKAKSAL